MEEGQGNDRRSDKERDRVEMPSALISFWKQQRTTLKGKQDAVTKYWRNDN